ncbi:MAG: hypothetical protein QXZ43_03030 [Candidatus Aenigmatarchaeota archaeon]
MLLRQWKNYWGIYSSDNNPLSKLINLWVLVTLLLILVIGLTGVSIKTGNYAKVLENNITNLKTDLVNCINAKDQYNSDLETCNINLQNKVSSLTTCQTDRNNLNDKLNICTKDLTKCEDRYDDLNSKYQSLSDNYDKCKNDLSQRTSEKNSLQSNYDQLKVNYISDFVGNFCCLKFKNTNTSKTYYIFANNDITCFNTTVSGASEYSC